MARQQQAFDALVGRWRHHALRRLPLFHRLKPSQLRAIQSEMECKVLPAGVALIALEERVDQLTQNLYASEAERMAHAQEHAFASQVKC